MPILRKDEKAIAIIIIIFAMMVLAVLGAVLAGLQSPDYQIAVEQVNSAQALYIAEGGLSYITEHEFNNDVDFSDNVSPTAAPFGSPSISLGQGVFWAEYLNQTSTSVDIKITAKVRDAIKVIQAHLGLSMPDAFKYSQFSSGNINLNSSQGSITGDIAAEGNVNIDEGITVSGDVQEGSQASIPQANFNFYQSKANEVIGDNVHFVSGTYGDATNGYIWYITGNVTIEGDSTINGTIVTEGNMIVQSPSQNVTFNAVAKNVDADPEKETMPALLIRGNFNFSGVNSITINGLIYSLGNENLNNCDNFTLNGVMVADGNTNMNNSQGINMTYDSSLVMGIPGFQSTGSPTFEISQWEEVN